MKTKKRKQYTKDEKIQVLKEMILFVRKKQEDDAPVFLCWYMCEKMDIPNTDEGAMDIPAVMTGMKQVFPELWKEIHDRCEKQDTTWAWSSTSYNARIDFLKMMIEKMGGVL